MSSSRLKSSPADQIAGFVAGIVGMSREEFETIGHQQESAPEQQSFMTGVMAPNNQPEFWADAPWRLEPDQTEIPITLIIRDANIDSTGYCPWHLTSLCIEQRLKTRRWHRLRTYLPADLPYVSDQGSIEKNFWVYRVALGRDIIQNAQAGETVHLRVTFHGTPQPYVESVSVVRHLEVLFARYALPQGRAERAGLPRRWFYGDPHYHSAYSNDIKEFGAPLPDTRSAGLAVGLDWLVVTDHSCDLVLPQEGGQGKTRWDQLKAEIRSAELSDDRFRFILGEEIALANRGEKYVHMLAIGGMQQVIPGAFMPKDRNNVIVDLCSSAIKYLLRFGKGYSPDLIPSLFGKLYGFEEVLDMLPENTLTFAAHPYDLAQIPPSRWDETDLANPRLTGHEFWNGRSRRSARLTDNPFTAKGWTDQGTLKRKDETRVMKLLDLVQNKWDPHLARGIEEWAPETPLPIGRPVFIAGSDAHGDFNYHAGMAWDYSKVDLLDDSSLGRVRTIIFLPEHQTASIPEEDEILAALKKGSCVVTDGPILEFTLRYKEQVAYMGDGLTVSGDGDPEMEITAYSTPEFGPVNQVEVIGYFKGQDPQSPVRMTLEPGQQASIHLDGEQGYFRLQTRTTGADGEQFCCFTNPIWVRVTEQPKKVKIQYSEYLKRG